MDDEILNLGTHKTYVLCERPKNRKVIGCKWVYKHKEDDKGYVSHYKARLITQGFTQVLGVDYMEPMYW
jgi:histone deacetylase 1/2